MFKLSYLDFYSFSLFFLKIRILFSIATAENPVANPISYRQCLQFTRSPLMMQKITEILNKSSNIVLEDFNFVLYYTLSRIIFSNGSRPELGYKAELAYIHKVEHENLTYYLIKLPFAKSGMTTAVMSTDDYRFFESYQTLRERLAQQKKVKDDKKYAFVNFNLKPLDHHISSSIKDIMVLNNFYI